LKLAKSLLAKWDLLLKSFHLISVPEKIVERIAELAKAKKIQGISDIVDLTDGQTGTNVVIELKNGFEPEEVLEKLFKLTPMEDAFAINAVALVKESHKRLDSRNYCRYLSITALKSYVAALNSVEQRPKIASRLSMDC
jgi:DNA gyrase/topoisomerase IV subunit A